MVKSWKPDQKTVISDEPAVFKNAAISASVGAPAGRAAPRSSRPMVSRLLFSLSCYYLPARG